MTASTVPASTVPVSTGPVSTGPVSTGPVSTGRPAEAADLGLLRDAVRAFTADLSDEPAVRRAIASPAGYDPAVWSRAASELGLSGMLLPEELGGLGFGTAELAAVGSELGAALFCGPFLGSVLAGACLAAIGDAGADLAGKLADGAVTALVAPAFADQYPAAADGLVEAKASGQAGTVTLHGAARTVVDADPAAQLIVAAATTSGWLIAAPEPAAPGLSVRRLETLDLTRRVSSVRFDGVTANVLARGDDAARALAAALAHGQVGLAADSAGLAGASLDRVVDHLRTRHQFGRPLASFQALKHACADLLVELEVGRTAVAAAANASPAQLRLFAPVAKIKATEAGTRIATESIQLTGGIGFTWEHPAHLYYRRAKSNELLLGTPDAHRRGLFRQLGYVEEGAS
jgi:alkylation response protein AidB-like acyl-CoA dehydrogenase